MFPTKLRVGKRNIILSCGLTFLAAGMLALVLFASLITYSSSGPENPIPLGLAFIAEVTLPVGLLLSFGGIVLHVVRSRSSK